MRTLVTLALAMLMGVAGCVQDTSPTPVASAPPAERLLTVSWAGGLCPNSRGCEWRQAWYADGTTVKGSLAFTPDDFPYWEGTDPLEYPPEDARLLARLVAATTLVDLDLGPFQGTCPTAWDGAEATYVLHRQSGEESISSCHREIDFNHPLMSLVEDLQRG
jgi:hypothetical protein